MKPRSQSTSSPRRPLGNVSAAEPSRSEPARRRLQADVAWATGTVVLAGLCVIPLLRLWRADLWAPFTLGGDAPYYLMAVKSVLAHGWWFENPDLGAPFGQKLYDFPNLMHEGFHFLLIKLLGVFSSDAVFVENLFFLLSFPLVALASFLVLRQLGISGSAALVCSVIFALAPYHFLRDHQHLTLAAYYSVPAGAYLVLSILSGKPLFTRRTSAGPRLLAWTSKRSLITLALCLFIANANSHYALFTELLLLAATTLVLVTRRDVRTLVQGGVALGLLFGFLVLAGVPHLLYWSANGPNPEVAHRLPGESESYALVFTQMVLPIPGHQIDALSNFAELYYANTPLKVEYVPYQALGFIATLGFAWLLLVALASCLSPRWGIGNLQHRQRHRQLAMATVIAFLIGTTGGVSSLFAWLVTPQIRAWDRISIFIAFFALAAVALLLDAARERIRPRRGHRVLVGALLTGVLLIGLYDQSNTKFTPNYSLSQSQYRSDASIVEAIDRELPPQAMVYQLPYVPFPENVQAGLEIGPYEPLRPYFPESDLRWSYGAIRGRPEADWQATLADKSTKDLVDTVVANGFDGIYIERFGYPDRAAKLESELRELLETEQLISPDESRSFFSLLPYKERL